MSTIHVIQFVIQSAGLSLFAWGIASCARRPERRASAALIGMLVCGLLPFLTSAPPVRETVTRHQVIRVEIPRMMETPVPAVSEEAAHPAAPMAPSVSTPAERKPLDWRWIIWLLPTGVCVGLFKITRDVWMTRRWSASLSAPDDAQWARIAAASPETMPRSAFRVSNDGPGPCLVGFWKPCIALPVWLLEPGKAHELEWAIRHECEHLRAHDSRWIVAVRLMTALHWWNPFVYLLARSWDHSRERVCDLKAAGDGGERSEYGHFILSLAAADQPRMAAAMAVSGNAKRLRKRIDSLLGAKRGVSRIGTLWRVAVVGLMCGAGWICSGFGFAQEKAAVLAGEADDDMSWLEPKPVLRISATAVISPKPIFEHEGQVTDEEVQTMLGRCERMKNCHVTSLGSGEIDGCAPLTLQLVATRDPNKIVDSPWDGVKRVNDFVGWVLHCIPEESDGDGPALRLKAAYAFAPGFHPAPNSIPLVQMPRTSTTNNYSTLPTIFPADSGWDQVAIRTGECRSRIQPASNLNLFLSLGEMESGVFAACLLKVTSRMPWEGWSCTIRNGYVRPFSHEVLDWILTESQKKDQMKIDESRAQFMKKVDSLPDNKNLLMLRTKTELALKAAREAKDLKEASRLDWMIHQIREKMWRNAPQELRHEDTLIMMRQGKLNELMDEPENRKRINEILKKRNEANGVIIKKIRR